MLRPGLRRSGAPEKPERLGGRSFSMGQIIRLGYGERPSPIDAFLSHPHLRDRTRETNTLYVAADKLGIDGIHAPGAGIFRQITANRILTDPSQKNRSVWRLPAWMHPDNGSSLTYHLSPNRWRMDGDQCVATSVAKGQEFVLRADTHHLEAWLNGLFRE
jgi:hypothetical protein